jgi:[protein-PII] uridylyltransferase
MRRLDHRPPTRRRLSPPSAPAAVAVAAAVGADRRRVRSDGADIRLTSLFVSALDTLGHPFGEPSGFALVATGGYGRRELAPASDLDVLLVHDGRSVAAVPESVAAVAERLWYPLWDDGVRLDHSVRTVAEARTAASADLRTALSLLDARHIVGDPALTLTLRTTLLADWRSAARTRLPGLRAMALERAATFGDLAHAQAPDLKEAHGGLRDLVLLDALVASWLVDVPHRKLDAARELLLDVRDALHAVTGRAADRLGPDDQPDVAAALGMTDRTELLRAVSGAARTVALTSDVTWRRVSVLLRGRRPRPADPVAADVSAPPGPRLPPLAPGVAVHDEEVVLARGADPVGDPTLLLRAAAAAARAGLPVAPATLDRLATVEPPAAPWPEPCREALVDLLGAGPGLVTVAELLDDHGILGRWLPAWDLIRCLPSSSPVHRWTVDRHSLETAVRAAEGIRRVSRPDLLLLGALLHDLGKGVPAPDGEHSIGDHIGADHSVAGAPIAAGVARAIGLPAADVATVVSLVRHHLLLADTATRRDLEDPATADAVVALLRAESDQPAALLDLLATLTEADARATGPAAWSPWRAGLVHRLVDDVRERLGVPFVPPAVPGQTRLHARLAELADRVHDSEPVVLLGAGPATGDTEAEPADSAGVRASWDLTVLAPDRPGLLAVVAGVLTSDRFSLRSAAVATDGTTALVQCVVARRPEEPPDQVRIRQLLTRALAGRLDLAGRLAARESGAQGGPGVRSGPVPLPVVAVIPGASASATVLEVRAADRPGLLYRVCSTISAAGGQLRSAHASTLGGDVVDVFYLVGPDGAPLGAEEADRLAGLISAGLQPQARPAVPAGR